MVKKKRVHRLYRDEGLTVRIPRRRKLASHLRIVPTMPMTANVQGTMDVAKDMLLDGRRFRALTMVGTYTRECQIIAVDAGVTGTKIVAALARAGPFLRSRLAYIRGAGHSTPDSHGGWYSYRGQVRLPALVIVFSLQPRRGVMAFSLQPLY